MKFLLFLPLSISLICSTAYGAATAPAADWPQWRGPNRDDRSPDKSILKNWPSNGPKQLWLFSNAGLGYAGFSIVADRLYTVGAREDVEHVICLDATTGKELWAAPLGPIYGNRWGDGPRSTPTVDGDRVYGLSGKGNLACISVKNGEVSWKVDLVNDLAGELQHWGYTESVLIDGPQLICTPGGSKGTVAALDKMSGKVLWQSKDIHDPAQYSSALVIEHGGQRQYVQRSMKQVFGIAQKDGKLLWRTEYPGGRTAVIPTPIYSNGIVYVTAGYGGGCKAVKLGSESPDVLYENKVMSNHHGGVILVGDKIYGHSESGDWTCQDFKTGAAVWQDKGIGKGACTYVAGMLVCLAEKDGTVALVDASPSGWKLHASFKLDPQTKLRSPSGKIWTHPVVLNGRLYLRDQELIYCYDVKG